MAKSKDKHDVDTVVYSKSKRIATTGIILRAKTEMFGADTHHQGSRKLEPLEPPVPDKSHLVGQNEI